MSGEYLRERHGRFQTPREDVLRHVREVMGAEAVGCTKIVAGYDNEVYRVEMARDGDVFVRIRRFGAVGFGEEAWAIEQCRAAGVPVPEILAVGSLSSGERELECMVQRAVAGRPIEDLWDRLSGRDLDAVAERIGVVMGQIHSVRVEGFGPFDTSRGWAFPTWEGLVRSQLKARRAQRARLAAVGFAEDEVDAMIEMVRELADRCPCSQPVLCHGDLGSGHLFVNDDLQLSGVIDFGGFQGGSPLFDFAILNLNDPEFPLPALKRGYAEQALPGDIELGVALHQLHWLMEALASGDGDDADEMARDLRQVYTRLERGP